LRTVNFVNVILVFPVQKLKIQNGGPLRNRFLTLTSLTSLRLPDLGTLRILGPGI